MNKTTYVLLHGGGHGGWCWQKVVPIIREAGYDVYTPTLTGLGERSHLISPEVDLVTHITDVVNVLQYNDLTNVILVGHSYAGMVITGVADRSLERVSQLVYLDAQHPRNGESLADLSEAIRTVVRSMGRVVDGVELVLRPDSPIVKKIYGVTDPDDFAWMASKLMPHPWKTFEQPLQLENESAVLKIPRTNINCISTLKLRSKNELVRALKADRVWEIDTGHDAMITEPVAVAEMLLRLASV